MSDTDITDVYRNKETGQVGIIHKDENGKRWIHPTGVVCEPIPFDAGKWEPNIVERPISRAQIAAVQFAAHKQLCAFLGMYGEARLGWDQLRVERRQEFMTTPPKGERLRGLYFAILEELDPNGEFIKEFAE